MLRVELVLLVNSRVSVCRFEKVVIDSGYSNAGLSIDVYAIHTLYFDIFFKALNLAVYSRPFFRSTVACMDMSPLGDWCVPSVLCASVGSFRSIISAFGSFRILISDDISDFDFRRNVGLAHLFRLAVLPFVYNQVDEAFL